MPLKMDIREATGKYENWMRSCGPLVEKHLRDKHQKMRSDPFQFLRGTYYRWAQLWPEISLYCSDAPVVLSVGDLHVNSFGTWRDTEGRLCWGVDDFDESWPLPYTNDLVRLVTSAKVARKLGILNLKTKLVCDVVLRAYVQTLVNGGCPIVLAEQELHLEKLGIAALKTPKRFWEKLNGYRALNGRLPADARQCLDEVLPDSTTRYKVIQREAGLGSLGQQRFAALAEFDGGFIAREIKRVVPSAGFWLLARTSDRQSYYEPIMRSAVRSRDPFQKIWKTWLVRRLSPDSNPIHVEELGQTDEETLLRAMGTETANVHLGQPQARKMILRDLERRGARWLRSAAKKMAQTVIQEWSEFRD